MSVTAIKLLGVAAGSGAGNRGAEAGPVALRELGLVTELRAIGFGVEDLGDVPGGHAALYDGAEGELARNLPEVLQVNRHTYAAVRNARRDSGSDSFLLIVGGDHSLAIGTLAGISDSCRRLGILWIDAHADFNTPVTSPSGNVHGMSLATACGRGHRELKAIAESEPMAEEQDVCLLGCRDLDPGEIENLQDSSVRWRTMQQWQREGLTATATESLLRLGGQCDHVHLSFDIDVLDAEHVPGTGTPVAGGLSPDEARELLTELGRTRVLRSAEVVEYNPRIDAADRRTGRLTCELIACLMKAMR